MGGWCQQAKRTSSTKISYSNTDGANRLVAGLGGNQKAFLLNLDRLVEAQDVTLNPNAQ